jgi:L-amino acid N-acyltransferase YncA
LSDAQEEPLIRAAVSDDAAQIAALYNHFVDTTAISFECEPLTPGQMAERLEKIQRRNTCFVDDEGGSIRGFAYAGPWHERAAYSATVETTVYVSAEHLGRGIGSALYRVLLDDLRGRDVHTAIGVIALPNPRSVALHERFGFVKVGELSAVGRKFDRWIDVGFWQLMLERYATRT